MLKINPLGPITTVAVHPNANKEIHEMILSKFPHENYQEWNYLIRDGRGIKTLDETTNYICSGFTGYLDNIVQNYNIYSQKPKIIRIDVFVDEYKME